jgi:3'-phosphoadenosine 5'-phosphosulfate sulfotransferase (PAPS reductase)/FAD synthetase
MLAFMKRCIKFPKEKKLKNYISEVTEAVVAGNRSVESRSKAEQAKAKAKIELFEFLPAKTKKNILLQSSGR